MAGRELVLSCISKAKILKWHVKEGDLVKKDKVLATYVFTEKISDGNNFIVQRKLKAKRDGKIVKLAVYPNEEILRGQMVAMVVEDKCEHQTVMKDMCCDCGADLRKDSGISGDLAEPTSAEVPVVHNIHELRVSVKEAERLARYDERQLLKARKLVLVVDLDMTLIHTTVEPFPKDAQDVFTFSLPGHPFQYNTKLRPGARKFLESISKFYELHIFTMGSRMYAHTVAKFLDPDGKFFAHRIRSRDEFINSFSKLHDLKALFPCGDHMVCIIDDREDVWNYASNLITVKPYKFFKGVGDINNPFNPESTSDAGPVDAVTAKKAAPGDVNQPTNSTNDHIVDLSTAKEDNSGPPDEHTSKEKDLESDLVIDLIGDDDDDDDCELEAMRKKDQSSDVDGPATNIQKSVDDGSESTGKLAVKFGDVSSGSDLDDYLFYLDEILERVHFAFYRTLDDIRAKGGTAIEDAEIARFCTPKSLNPDVRVIVPELRRHTLKGASLVFTGVVPTNVPLEKSKPYRTAIALGARVTSDICIRRNGDEQAAYTTHVVAARLGTQKAHKASRSTGIKLVNPNWLWCSAERWEWAEESIFPVPDINGKLTPVPSRQGTPQDGVEVKSRLKVESSPLAKSGDLTGGQVFLPDVNPLSSFSRQELDAMDKEVEELMNSADEEDENDVAESGSVSHAFRAEDNSTAARSEDSEELGSITQKRRTSPVSSELNGSISRRNKKQRRDTEETVDDEHAIEKLLKDGRESRSSEVSVQDANEDDRTSSSASSSANNSGSSDQGISSEDEEDLSSDRSSSCSRSSGSENDAEIGDLLERRLSESSS